ncbi:unnamed protein product [Timema podura]|uniref:Uncharacterized protein n=1 Tax=Timema podura TaxID=61482 RepID=A0ABN7NXY9_TIMPD|nr:unnamed protein product [Timema podura]
MIEHAYNKDQRVMSALGPREINRKCSLQLFLHSLVIRLHCSQSVDYEGLSGVAFGHNDSLGQRFSNCAPWSLFQAQVMKLRSIDKVHLLSKGFQNLKFTGIMVKLSLMRTIEELLE